jgi:dCTP deaminase
MRAGIIHARVPFTAEQIQPASLDLRLGGRAYRIRASFLPGSEHSVEDKMRDLVMSELDLTRPTVLERHCLYLIRLEEALNLPRDISARANPRSSTGRLDVFTRLVVDRSEEFEAVAPGYKGPLYVEVFPGTFGIAVQAGMRLNQIRFLKGRPSSHDRLHVELHESENLVYEADQPGRATIRSGLRVSVSLEARDQSGLVGYRALPNAPVIDFGEVGGCDPRDFWEPVSARSSLILNPGDFYLLGSKEKIRVPSYSAAEMVAFDPSIGEFRIHYAGFFDPGFGYGAGEILGTTAVLEVRAHEVPFMLEDGQTIGRLIYSLLLEPSSRVYGLGIGSSYQEQGLALSKHFRRADRSMHAFPDQISKESGAPAQ